MLRTKRVLILKWIKIKHNFVGIAKTMLQKHHKTERKMTAQFLAQLLQRLQNTDVGLYSTAQSFASRRDRSLETRLGFLAQFSLHQSCGSSDLWGAAPEHLNRHLKRQIQKRLLLITKALKCMYGISNFCCILQENSKLSWSGGTNPSQPHWQSWQQVPIKATPKEKQ